MCTGPIGWGPGGRTAATSVATWLFICATVSALADLATLVVLVGRPLLALVRRGGGGRHRR